MANERKTENIVRSHFEQYKDSVEIEEQSSENPKIDKLLKSASKRGGGKGYPEFIISYKNNPDLLVVVECKANVVKHESKERDKYNEFAVDGALLYASYLSKEFDILAIAVSGEEKNHLKVSHFLQLKNEKKAVTIFGDKLLPAGDYLNGYLKSPDKFRQDYEALLDFAKRLNDKLHIYKILESQRSLLISCILIALENPAFRASYKSHKTPKDLAGALVHTVSSELKNANITGERLENLNIQFSFIKTDTSLSTKEKVLRELVDEIDENINSFIKTHEYFDVLGQLYIEFLRYANSDKGLGIVLTPPHITEFFSDLAQVNKNTIAYDNCAGTGGFLISAMKRMIANAKGDEVKIKEIKAKQLIGTEYQSHIFALAVSNMYIHQDGKTNIINGSCFDEDVIEVVKAQKPTVGFLNPPYKSDKKRDTDELEFVLNNLGCLVDGGTCVAIVPINCALEQKGKTFELKKKLLEKHTLEAVLTMPDELFINSDVGVISCIMIFTAHKPHPKNKETFFGYYKDDGFIKRKNKGRIDGLGKWEIIKEKWVNNFLNRKNEAGLSINISVKAEDEWCAEAHMETDYNSLTKEKFELETLKYATYSLFNRKKKNVSDSSVGLENLILRQKEWKIFEIGKLFEIEKGREKSGGNEKGEIPLISATRENNGINTYILEGNKLFKGNTITVPSNGASTGEAFYQAYKYYATGDVNVLHPKFKLNPFVAIFIITIIRLEKYRFNYGRKWGKDRMEKSKIKLPAKNNHPDWEFVENYIKSLSYSSSL